MARRDRNGYGLNAVRIMGGLLPPEFLQTIARLDAKWQTGTDYGLSKSLVLKDEIARYWRIANDLYAGYQERRKRADLDSARLTVDEWLIPLLREVLGYSDLAATSSILIGDRRFPVTHCAMSGSVPIVLIGGDIDLDKADFRFGDEGRRRAPYGLTQELLNADDSRLWGVVSSGDNLRLLRDNPTLTRPAYIEADLARIFDEQLYADFAALWLTIHASRVRPKDGKPSACILEAWRAQANETGERALEHLRDGVRTALLALGNGFIKHSRNEALRGKIQDGALTADSYFQELLRLVYRLLFLLAAEDRNLLHSPEAADEPRHVYRDGYSLGRLRERALRRRHYDRHSDQWEGLLIVFSALSNGATALGLPALGGLFGTEQCANLDAAAISNENLLEAIRALTYFRSGATLSRVNYRDMGTEELGSVYESLLELLPCINVGTMPWAFYFAGHENGDKASGSARKVTGSYYTPTALVQELINTALVPVMNKAVAARPQDPRGALLELKIVDPACGSGHFLLAAARQMAVEIARIESGADTPDEMVRQHALREVVQHCIYGVDRNPLAAELCKAALWIETVEPGKPLTFLDPHIHCGDSLIGILEASVLREGIPDEAYKPLTADDASVCKYLKKRNKQSGEALQGSLFGVDATKTATELEVIDAMPEETVEQITAKRRVWERAHAAVSQKRERLSADLFVGAFFADKNGATSELVPLTEDLHRVRIGIPMRAGVEEFVADVVERHKVFHWNIAFSEIMRHGGFDVVLGNPPWEQLELDPKKYFANSFPEIAASQNLAETLRKVQRLKEDAPATYAAYQSATKSVHAQQAFVHASGRYPLTSYGRINFAPLFAELTLQILRKDGRAGLILPSGIATDSFNQRFFAHISHGHLVQLLDFENRERLFPAVHSSAKFSLLTFGASKEMAFCFFLTKPDQSRDPRRRLLLTSQDIASINPNTRTAPVFRSSSDAELSKKIYRSVPVLANTATDEDPWNISFKLMFMMNTDSKRFQTAQQFDHLGADRNGTNWIDEQGETWVPLYEAKMVDFYDHRAASYAARGNIRGHRVLPDTTVEQHRDQFFEPEPFYWVKLADVRERVPSTWHRKWLFGFKNVTSPTNERTFICTPLPYVGVGHSMPLLFSNATTDHVACLIANLSSIILDYIARQKVGGINLSAFYVEQFAVLPPSTYNERDIAFIVPRVLELTYTSASMRAFAEDLGHTGPSFSWDVERRGVIRAELDAYFARLYGLSRDNLRYILDPADVYGPDYPSETFRVLKQRELSEFGEYRTARRILKAWDDLAQGMQNAAMAG